METLLDNLGQWVLDYPAWSHAILGAATIIQGEITIFVATYLVINGNLTWGEYLFSTVGILLLAEIFVYALTRHLRTTRFGWKMYKKMKPNRRLQQYALYLKSNMKKLLIAAKFLPGTNLIILVLAGWSKVKFGEFMRSYLVSVFLWFTSLTAVAYFLMSGLHYLKSEKVFRNIEIVMGVVVLLIIFGESFLRKLMRKISSLEARAESIGTLISGDEPEEPEKTEDSSEATSSK